MAFSKDGSLVICGEHPFRYGDRSRESLASGDRLAVKCRQAACSARHRVPRCTPSEARLGHKTATETLDTYAHVWGDADEQTRNILNEALPGFGRETVSCTCSPRPSPATY
jgi:hypothetical protein